MSLYSLCNVSVFLSFINFDLRFRGQGFGWVGLFGLCATPTPLYQAGLLFRPCVTKAGGSVRTTGSIVWCVWKVMAVEILQFVFIFAAFLDPVHLNSEVAVA